MKQKIVNLNNHRTYIAVEVNSLYYKEKTTTLYLFSLHHKLVNYEQEYVS